jgi:hypothetical protein
MKLPFTTVLKKIIPERSTPQGSHTINILNVVWWCIIALGILFLAIIAWSWYFFHTRVIQPPETITPVQRQTEVTEEDIDMILNTLDTRQKQFDNILGQ